MVLALISFVTAYVYIGLKATQQLSVVNGRFLWVLPVSIAMGLCEAGIVLMVVQSGTLFLGLMNGLGGGLGAMTAMVLNRRWKH